MLKSKQRFKSKKLNVFTGKLNALSVNDDKTIQSIGLIETYTYATSKDLVCRNKRLHVSI